MWEIGTLGNYVLKLIVHIYITLLGGSKDLPARRSLCMQIYSSVVVTPSASGLAHSCQALYTTFTPVYKTFQKHLERCS